MRLSVHPRPPSAAAPTARRALACRAATWLLRWLWPRRRFLRSSCLAPVPVGHATPARRWAARWQDTRHTQTARPTQSRAHGPRPPYPPPDDWYGLVQPAAAMTQKTPARRHRATP